MDKDEKQKQRTLLQNRALHKYFTLLSEELNSAGLDMRKTLKQEISIDWTPSNIKAYLWKPIQEAMYQKKSTTELDTKEISKVFEVLNRYLGEKLEIHVPFPSNEPDMIEEADR